MIESSPKTLHLGFVLNPVAGAGGPAARKGSDAREIREQVFAGEILSPAADRARGFFEALLARRKRLRILCPPGPMGADQLQESGLQYATLDCEVKAQSDSADTQKVCRDLLAAGVDLLVFAGGDGTARDVYDVVGDSLPCLGIPSGVKMQSGVFGIHPQASADIVHALLDGKTVALELGEVRDIDEAALCEGRVSSRHYGDMKVPFLDELVQQVKQGGGDIDPLVILDIADELRERFQDLAQDTVLVFGPGSTTHALESEFGYAGSLLGVDVIEEHEQHYDVSEDALFTLLQKHPAEKIRLVLTIIGGQGHLIGRGNQQLSPRILNYIGRENLWVVAAPHKLSQLQGRPLIIDSGDAMLNKSWRGLLEVISGYRKISLHRLD